MPERIDELLVGLGLEIDKQSFDNGMASFTQLRGAAMGLAAALGVGVGGASLTTGFANSRQELGNFAAQMDVSAQAVRGLEFAFEQVGGQASEARSAIEQMVEFQDALRRGDPGAFNAMSLLGLDPRSITQAEDAEQAIRRVMNAMEGMDEQQRRIILQDMGIGSEAAFRLFGEGAEQLQAYMDRAAELAPVTERQIELADDFNQELVEMKTAVEGVTNALAEQLLPTLTGWIEWFNENLDQGDTAELIQKGPFRYFFDKGREALSGAEAPSLGGGMEIRRGQGGGTDTLSGALSGRSGPPSVSVPDLSIRRGQGGGSSSLGGIFSGIPDQGAATWVPDIWPETLQGIETMMNAMPAAPAASPRELNMETLEAIRRRQEEGRFTPEDREYLREQMREQFPERYQGSNVTFNISGAGDPEAVALAVDRRLSQHAERTANDFRSSVV